MEKSEKVAEVLLAWGDFIKLFLLLDAGAILLIATFLRDEPGVPGSKYLVSMALEFFFSAFIWFTLALVAWSGRAAAESKREKRFVALSIGWGSWGGLLFFGFGIFSLLNFARAVVSTWP